MQKEAFARPRKSDAAEALHAVALLQGSDDGVEGGSLLRSGGEVEPAQDCGRLVAGGLKDAIEEVGDRFSDGAELRRKSEQDRPRPEVGLLLQPFRHPLRDALNEKVDLLRNFADAIVLLVRCP